MDKDKVYVLIGALMVASCDLADLEAGATHKGRQAEKLAQDIANDLDLTIERLQTLADLLGDDKESNNVH